MIAIEQNDLAHRPHAAMGERMIGEPRGAGPHHGLVRNAAERDDGAKFRHFRNRLAEKAATCGDFSAASACSLGGTQRTALVMRQSESVKPSSGRAS